MNRNDFSGKTAEPMVGEVTALRSFRITDDGYLLPLSEVGGHKPWPTSTSSAKCGQGQSHLSPDPECTCGFYAYGHRAWVEQSGLYSWSRVVLAAVHCSGRLVAGEKGVRAEKMRMVACYVNRFAPEHVMERLRENYPEVHFYTSRKALLKEHPETHLSTYLRKPKGMPALAWTSIVQMGLGALAVPFLTYLLVNLALSENALSVAHAFSVIFAILVWVPLVIEAYSLYALGLTPDSLTRMRHLRGMPWRGPRRPFWEGPLLRIVTLVLAFVAFLLLPHKPLDESEPWQIAALALVGVTCIALTWLELRKVLPLRKRFPLVPRTHAVQTLAQEVGEGNASREPLDASYVGSRTVAIEMHSMGEYGVGLIHFDIVSDPEDYPPADASADTLTKVMANMALSFGLKKGQWIAYIASSEDRLRVLTPGGEVSPPMPMAEIDSILPIPDLAWCPAQVRPAYVQGRDAETLDGEAPYSLPIRYQESRPLMSFSDPRIENALRIAQSSTEQAAYRNFKQTQASLPGGLEPMAVPTLPSETKGSLEGRNATEEVTWALGSLMDTKVERPTARSLTFAVGELIDALAALGIADDVMTMSRAPSTELETQALQSKEGGPDTDFRAAHLFLAASADLALSDPLLSISYDVDGGRLYSVMGAGKRRGLSSLTLLVRPFGLERGGGDDGDALSDAEQ